MTNKRCAYSLVLAFVFFLIIQNSQAEVFEFDLYTLKEPRTVTGNFFNDYDLFETCEVEIDSAAIQPNAFIDIHSDDFKRFSCTIAGNHGTYTFSYGSEIKRDYWRGTHSSSPYLYGLLFDSAGKPLRFDSPQFSTANLVGFYDTEGRENPDGTVDIVGAPFLDPKIHDTYDIPPAVLLEPTIINGVKRERGVSVRSDLLPEGAHAALVNGEFSFDEGFYDVDGNNIQGLILGRFLSFDQKLRTPQVRITQAVFQDESSKDPIKLVHERTTAIIVNRGSFSSGAVTLRIKDKDSKQEIFSTTDFKPLPNTNQVVFYCDDNLAQSYCDLHEGSAYIFEASINPGDGGFWLSEKIVEVERTDMLDIFFVELISPFCVSKDFCGMSDKQTVIEKVIDDNTFIRNVFPIRDKGLGLAKDPSKIGDSYKSSAIAFGTTSKGPIEEQLVCAKKKSIKLDRSALDRDAKLIASRQRMFPIKNPIVRKIGYVSKDYFSNFTSSNNITGVNIPIGTSSETVQFVTIGSGSNNTAHELGHSFGLPVSPNSLGIDEEYELDKNCKRITVGKPANGFNVYADISQNQQAYLNDAYNYMGAAGATDKPYWVNLESWEKTRKALQNGGKDPDVLFFSLILNKDGSFNLGEWMDMDGFPSGFGEGNYSIQTFNHSGTLLGDYTFSPSFSRHFSPFGKVEFDTAIIAVKVPYEAEVARIHLVNDEGLTLLDIDPAYKVFTDTISEISQECTVSDQELQWSKDVIQRFKTALEQKKSDVAIRIIQEETEPFLNKYKDQCTFLSQTDEFRDRLLDHMPRTIKRIEARFGSTVSLRGDLDFDGDVDRDDLNILMAHRNQPASGEDDPMDLDGDGQITGLDARKLTQLCTRPRCATE